MSKELKAIKAQVKVRLIELDMTQTQLANSVNVTKSVISDLLTYGKGSSNVKANVAAVLGINNPWEGMRNDS
ncbi:TPA: XRE family transcriptional regulator [Streptococcus pyogenes]|nr:XRE family transcriptional regulator [Streptococcus pyogenes]HES1441346.1 XRE family transcriptional regulator [Streptococcus pyogenes]